MVETTTLLSLLERQAVVGLPQNAAVGLQVEANGCHEGLSLTVMAKVRRDGVSTLGYRFGGVRLERTSLLRLLCPELDCDEAQAARLRWNEFAPCRGARVLRTRARAGGRGHCSPVHLQHQGRLYEARPSIFTCVLECPVEVHAPRAFQTPGWDLYQDGRWVAGALSVGGKRARPRFPTLESIADFLSHVQGVHL